MSDASMSEPLCASLSPASPASAAVSKPGRVSAVSMLQNSLQVLQSVERLRLDERHEDAEHDEHAELEHAIDDLEDLEELDDLQPDRVTALVAETLGLEHADDAEVSALMRESLAVAEQLAAASLMTPAAAKRRLQARSLELNAEQHEYVPPRALLLYLVRMGSFSSAPRIVNPDNQDDGVELPPSQETYQQSREALCRWCAQQLVGTPAKLVSRRMVPTAPEHPVDGRTTWRNDDASTIRFMQWNVLSQALGVNNDNFVACPRSALDWSIRRPLMLQELAAAEPDIICLQEVDHYKMVERALSPLGYRGLWEPKPDSPCLYLQDNNGPDGCALLWRADRFTLLHEHRATLHVWRIPSNQVVLLAVLRHEPSGRELCVATTHLKARAGALMSTLRNEQGRDLLRVVAAHAGDRPVLLAGDFNAEPAEPVYRTVLQNPALRLASAYSKAEHKEGAEEGDPVTESAQAEPPYTTWKVREEGEQCHTIDYIFYSRSAFSVSALLDFPDGEVLGAGRVPSYQYPSDHFALCADLRLREPGPEHGPPGRCATERTK